MRTCKKIKKPVFFAWEPTLKERSFFTSGEILSILVPTCPYRFFFHEPIIPFIIPFMVPYTCLVGAFCANMAYQSTSSFVRRVLLKIISILLGSSGGPLGVLFTHLLRISKSLESSGVHLPACHRPTSSSSWCKILLEFCSSWHDILTPVTSYDLLSYLHSWC